MGSDDVAALLAGWRETTEAATSAPWTVITDDHGRNGVEHSAWHEESGRYIAEVVLTEADAGLIVTARTATPRLVAAVEAVLKRHVEAVIKDMPAPPFRYCKTCAGHPKWPCPEVQAITAALTGEEASDG
jgi:hypothetical protein